MSQTHRHNALGAVNAFRKDESGVALVEFAIFLPIFLLAFFIIIEFSRIFFSYQGAVSGVRDATRYLARTTDAAVCVGRANGAGDVISIGSASDQDATYAIIARNMNNENNVLPEKVSILSVTSSFRCVRQAVGDFRQREVPIARVVARVSIQLPLGGVLELNGRPLINAITTDVAEESRVFGV